MLEYHSSIHYSGIVNALGLVQFYIPVHSMNVFFLIGKQYIYIDIGINTFIEKVPKEWFHLFLIENNMRTIISRFDEENPWKIHKLTYSARVVAFRPDIESTIYLEGHTTFLWMSFFVQAPIEFVHPKRTRSRCNVFFTSMTNMDIQNTFVYAPRAYI